VTRESVENHSRIWLAPGRVPRIAIAFNERESSGSAKRGPSSWTREESRFEGLGFYSRDLCGSHAAGKTVEKPSSNRNADISRAYERRGSIKDRRQRGGGAIKFPDLKGLEFYFQIQRADRSAAAEGPP
jgi:hypothetical protein